MQTFKDPGELAERLLWTAACATVAIPYASVPAVLAVAVGAWLGCLAARRAARRSARWEGVLTFSPFAGVILLLMCSQWQHSPLTRVSLGPLTVGRLAEMLLGAAAAFAVSLAFALLRAQSPQAAASRVVVSLAGLASPFVFDGRCLQFLLRNFRLDPSLAAFLLVVGLLASSVLLAKLIRRLPAAALKSGLMLARLTAVRSQGAFHSSVNS